MEIPKRGESYFQLAYEHAPYAMVMINDQRNIVLVNSQTEELFGYKRNELLGQPVEILLPEPAGGSHPGIFGDFFAQRKDGKQFRVEIGLNRFETEGRTWTLCSVVDIAGRTAVEAMLRESEERFRNMADTAPVMIWVSGADKLCTFFNKGWLDFTGGTMERELGNGWTRNVHPEDRDRCWEIYSSSFDKRRRFRMEYRLRRADGQYRWLLDDGVPRYAGDGEFAGYIGSCVDTTEVKRAQEEALAAQKLESLGQLSAGIAHDFNNLLGSIRACAELLLADREERGSPPEEELLGITTAAVRGAEMVRQLMIYAGEPSPAFEPVDFSSLVAEMVQLLRASISKNATLKIEINDGLPALHANAAQIRQVVMNLVTNASEALGDWEGVIRVATSRAEVGPGAASLSAGDYLKLEVSDTGSGMTPEVQARIFDPFFTTKSTGRGLGLAAVRGIVRGHNGAIKVVSSLGRGARFEVLLPCSNQPAPKFNSVTAPTYVGGVGSVTGTVLVAEDEEMLRVAVSKMLRMKSFSVIEAIDGSAAVDLFRSHARDVAVVLLDLNLPLLGGSEVFAELRRIQPDVKVILTTAYSRETALTALDGQQPWAFIRKPYQLADLLQLLWDACLPEGLKDLG